MNQSSIQRIIALLTDFGSGDSDVGIMKGVMLGIASHIHIVDITHAVAPQNVASGAWILGTCYRYFPRGTIYTCVVDPGVGSSRQHIALHAGEWCFVGPDNGLFSYVLAEQIVHEVVILANPLYHLPQVSTTFHGRDIFAPASAHLARGVALSELGPQLDPSSLQRLPQGLSLRQGGQISGHIVHVDHFGNLVTNIPLSQVPELFSSPAVQVTFIAQQHTVSQRRRFFADTAAGSEEGTAFIYGDSSGYLAVAVQNGSAAQALHAGYGDAIDCVIEGD